VTINNVYTFLNITGSGMVTINGTKDGVDQEIENKRADYGETIKMAENTNVVCNGGKYKSSGWNPNHNCSSPDVFDSEGTLELRNVTAEVEGFGDTIVASGNLTIDGGTFKSGVKASGPISPILHFAAQERALYMAEPLKQWVTTAQFDFSGII
jgi:hypothetical protein